MCCANPAQCLNWCLALTEAVVEALKTALERARPGQDIEVGCLGGHGRTGTALACLAS